MKRCSSWVSQKYLLSLRTQRTANCSCLAERAAREKRVGMWAVANGVYYQHGQKIIRIETIERYVNGALVALVMFYVYIFIFHSFSFIFWSAASVPLAVLFGVRFYLSREEIRSRQNAAVAQKVMRDVAQNLSLEYHARSTALSSVI